MMPQSTIQKTECIEDFTLSPLDFFSGDLVSVDSYMNLQLASTEEYIDGQFTSNLGEVLIRTGDRAV